MTEPRRPTKREIKAMAYHLVDLITTKTAEVQSRTGLPFEAARFVAIAEMAGE